MHVNYQQSTERKVQGLDKESRRGARVFGHTFGKRKDTTGRARPQEAANEVQATALPDPTPADSSSEETKLTRTTLTIPPTFSVTAVGNAASTNQVLNSAEHSPTARSTITIWIPAAKESTSSHAVIPTGPEPSHSPSSSSSTRIPVYGVILLVAGAVGLALAAALVFRCFLRHSGRVDRPRPSAPILQDSPLFGGNERFSRGIWSDPSFNSLLSSHAKTEKGGGWRPLSGYREQIYEKTPNNRQSTYLTTNLAVNETVPLPLSPASVYTTAAPSTAVGIALEFPIPPQTVKPNTQPLKVKNKGTEEKTSRRRSTRASMYGYTDIGSPTLTEAEAVIAYQALRPAPTPGKPKAAQKPSGPSRDHVQRSTRKNAPSRASQSSLYRSPSASRAGRGREKEEPFLYVIPSVKSQERRDRDTRALTSALGLPSPPPPSSCFSPVSIYPDDSLSVAHGRGSTRPPSEPPSPSATHTALGDMMLQDFPSTATFSSVRTGDTFTNDPVGKKGNKGRVTDRPPRVPSPPPLPSLSQMALANADADYRSPTYSIYGLYESQRKSRTSIGDN